MTRAGASRTSGRWSGFSTSGSATSASARTGTATSPLIGPVHNAAGYLLSEMLGCRVEYKEDAPPQVVPAGRQDLELDVEAAFAGQPFSG